MNREKRAKRRPWGWGVAWKGKESFFEQEDTSKSWALTYRKWRTRRAGEQEPHADSGRPFQKRGPTAPEEQKACTGPRAPGTTWWSAQNHAWAHCPSLTWGCAKIAPFPGEALILSVSSTSSSDHPGMWGPSAHSTALPPSYPAIQETASELLLCARCCSNTRDSTGIGPWACLAGVVGRRPRNIK